jgi:hypothetical protein
MTGPMLSDSQLMPERLTELRDEVLEALQRAKPGSEAVSALDAQLDWIDGQLATSGAQS